MLNDTANDSQFAAPDKEKEQFNIIFDTHIFQEDSEFVQTFSQIFNIKADIESSLDQLLALVKTEKCKKLHVKLQSQLKDLKDCILSCANAFEDERQEMFRVAQQLVRMQQNDDHNKSEEKSKSPIIKEFQPYADELDGLNNK